MSKKNKIILFIVIVFLTIIFTPLFGKFYELIIGHKMSSGFWGPSHPEYFVGFIMAFLFLGSLLSWLTFTDKKIKYWVYYILPLLVFLLILGSLEGVIIGVGFVLAGWLLAQGGLLIYKKIQKN